MHRRMRITGRVQGVGFRWSAIAEAERCGVSGRIRNLDDGSVEADATGEPDAVEHFTEWMRVGPPGARVDDVEIEELLDHDQGGSDGFRIQ